MKKKAAFLLTVFGISLITCYSMLGILDSFFSMNTVLGGEPLFWGAIYLFVEKLSLPFPKGLTFLIWSSPIIFGVILVKAGMKKLD